MQQLAISIAMTTYNGARDLGEPLDSLATQQLLPSGLVVMDNGSTDDTIAPIESFARTAPFPVRLHRDPERLSRLDELAPSLRQRAAAAVATWRTLPGLRADRIAVCSGARRTQIAASRRLHHAGAYGTDIVRTFDAKAVKKNLFPGVLLAPPVQRPGRLSTSLEDGARRRGSTATLRVPTHAPSGLAA